MAVTIRLAESAQDLDGIFRARHRVCVDIEHFFPPTPDRRIVDRFDPLPTTRNILAEHDGLVVGGVRFTLSSPVGTPADEQFDFSDVTAHSHHQYAAISMLFLEPLYRGTKVTRHLLSFGYTWLASTNCPIVIAVSNPAAITVFDRDGYSRLSARPKLPPQDPPLIPIALDLQSSGWSTRHPDHRFAEGMSITVDLSV